MFRNVPFKSVATYPTDAATRDRTDVGLIIAQAHREQRAKQGEQGVEPLATGGFSYQQCDSFSVRYQFSVRCRVSVRYPVQAKPTRLRPI